mmetsp:Transcript_25772/g.48345  ORF Transcript_25772/g.48345 Transcript_25772/m.48345 type:complete len:196 (+) Transcript_25772:41-628(+)
MSEVLVPFVNCLMVLDSSGERIMAKYYDQRPKSEQDKYEALLHKKTKTLSFRSDAEVLLLDQEVFVVRGSSDCKIVVSGCIDENELILVSVLDVIYETILSLLRGQLDRRTILDNLELVLLTIDEVIDHGHIMELDPHAVSGRVLMKGSSDANTGGGSTSSSSSSNQSQSQGDMTISQALGMAGNSFLRSLTTGN